MNKGGVDVFDQLCHAQTTTCKTKRWQLRYFFGELDAAVLNAYIICTLDGAREEDANFSLAKFLKDLTFALAKQLMEQRIIKKFLPKILRTEIATVLGKELTAVLILKYTLRFLFNRLVVIIIFVSD
ncbi:hypothetical protein PR048_017539 [Dryococelus australis]|uniref:PiggyBac transposable element-derived protein domain-containing protein n=1 Tax=Dryococelus australis TaxID=614101 RepID=A0ABQ9H9Z7_9NEOP|nr:hypothetical protein PR048_017539 [Dryococelus australis]